MHVLTRERHRKNAGGYFDLGQPEGRSCIECRYLTLETDHNLANPSKLRYGCSRFVDLLDGAPLNAHEARVSKFLCGPQAVGFEPDEAPMMSRRDAVDIREGRGSCATCVHSVFSTEVHARACLRLVDGEGRPTNCKVARRNTNFCGPDGRWWLSWTSFVEGIDSMATPPDLGSF